jgi:hypothetical protein
MYSSIAQIENSFAIVLRSKKKLIKLILKHLSPRAYYLPTTSAIVLYVLNHLCIYSTSMHISWVTIICAIPERVLTYKVRTTSTQYL